MKTSSRRTPLSRNPCPTLSSLPYAWAVSMCRYPSSSAQRTASTHSRAFSTCQTPSPSIGITWPSASSCVLSPCCATPAITSARLRQERVHVGGELAVVLEEKAVGRVRVDLDPRVREEPGQEVRVTGQDHRVAVAVGNEDREVDRGGSLEQRVVGNAPRADGVVLRLAGLPRRRFVSVGCPCAEDASGRLPARFATRVCGGEEDGD